MSSEEDPDSCVSSGKKSEVSEEDPGSCASPGKKSEVSEEDPDSCAFPGKTEEDPDSCASSRKKLEFVDEDPDSCVASEESEEDSGSWVASGKKEDPGKVMTESTKADVEVAVTVTAEVDVLSGRSEIVIHAVPKGRFARSAILASAACVLSAGMNRETDV